MFYVIINFVEIHQITCVHIKLGESDIIELENPKNYYYYLQNPKDVHFFYEALKELKKNPAEIIRKYAKGSLEPYSIIRQAYIGFIEQDQMIQDGSCRLYEANIVDGVVNLKLIKNMDHTDKIDYKKLVENEWED